MGRNHIRCGIPTLVAFLTMQAVGARHCQKPLGQHKGLNLSATVGLSKTRVFDHKPFQNVSSTVEFAKTRASDPDLVKRCLQQQMCNRFFETDVSTVGFTKTRAFDPKSCQNCANLLYPNNTSKASLVV